METIIESQYLTNSDLQSAILSNSGLLLIVVVTEGNGACYIMESTITDLTEDILNQCSIYKMDYESNTESSYFYGIQQTPTILIFRQGQLIDKIEGLLSKAKLISRLKKNIKRIT
jgi:thioredoxin 1